MKRFEATTLSAFEMIEGRRVTLLMRDSMTIIEFYRNEDVSPIPENGMFCDPCPLLRFLYCCVTNRVRVDI